MTCHSTSVWPKENGRIKPIAEIFGEYVFTHKALQASLPKPVYLRFVQQIKGSKPLDKTTTDAVAHAVIPMEAFSGSQLIQSEPDASSFPNGGIRSTFEARGYTIWDTASPMFIRKGPFDTSVLYIPSVFISYHGDALDEKTILLRSQESLKNSAVRLLQTLGHKDVDNVIVTLGCEQEFFLIDRETYNKRTDLKISGRTLIGTIPPKHQQLEDHYFGQIPSQVLACLAETELELFRLGVPVKTRHNEVAPKQFEMAPIFEECSVAIDHNLLTMETLHQVAHRHGLKVLFHEKPFKGVNGSGKHANWSMSTNTGENLLDPSDKPETNYKFLLVLVAILDALVKHSGLLRAGIASSSNEHRLGANEAPPGIVSAFLGEHLTEVLDSIEANREVRVTNHIRKTVKLGGTVLDLQVPSLPAIARDLTDRNRTSPFAFTGNKFEFRAVGSKQSPSFPVCVLNAAVSASLIEMTEALIKQKGTKAEPSVDDILSVVRVYIKKTKSVRFEGNGYSQEWVVDAASRGLLNIKSAPEAFKQLLVPSNASLLVSQGIMTEEELHSRYHIMCDTYSKDLLIESNTLLIMVRQGVLPAAFGYRKSLAESLVALQTIGEDIKNSSERKMLNTIAEYLSHLEVNVEKLSHSVAEMYQIEEADKQAEFANSRLSIEMQGVREYVDKIEEFISNDQWPYPKYSALLF